jgi:hypothetical protein
VREAGKKPTNLRLHRLVAVAYSAVSLRPEEAMANKEQKRSSREAKKPKKNKKGAKSAAGKLQPAKS